MKRDNLDNIDIKILKTLQENGRVTNVELAEKVDLSAPIDLLLPNHRYHLCKLIQNQH